MIVRMHEHVMDLVSQLQCVADLLKAPAIIHKRTAPCSQHVTYHRD
jgi:hypothetical protein